jgi:Holliday junction resolvase RusA-like endonuclease
MLIVIPGEPVGKGRPRFSTRGGYARAYTPKKTADYEEQILTAYMLQCKGERYEKGTYLSVSIKAYFKIPKSAKKADKEQMRLGKIRPAKKPDIDNVMKICCDALNGVAFDDDCQFTAGNIKKRYSDDPRIEISIEEDTE